MTQPQEPKTQGGDRFGRKAHFSGPGLTPRAPGPGSLTQKLLARSLGDPENFTVIRDPVEKLQTFFAGTHRRTDRQTDRQTDTHWGE